MEESEFSSELGISLEGNADVRLTKSAPPSVDTLCRVVSDYRSYATWSLPARAPPGSKIFRPWNRLRSGSSWNARAHRSSFDGRVWNVLLLAWSVETLARGLRDRGCPLRFDGTSQRFHGALRLEYAILLALFDSNRDMSLV